MHHMSENQPFSLRPMKVHGAPCVHFIPLFEIKVEGYVLISTNDLIKRVLTNGSPISFGASEIPWTVYGHDYG